jgi:20S proteasome alpha/beta subunit
MWTATDNKFALFNSSDTTVTPVVGSGQSGYHTIGFGFPVAEYALGLTYHHGMSVEDAKFVAALAVKAAKDYAETCGGRTNIITIRNIQPRRVAEVPASEVRDAEQYSDDCSRSSK